MQVKIGNEKIFAKKELKYSIKILYNRIVKKKREKIKSYPNWIWLVLNSMRRLKNPFSFFTKNTWKYVAIYIIINIEKEKKQLNNCEAGYETRLETHTHCLDGPGALRNHKCCY